MKSLEQDVATTLAMLRRRINAHESPVYRLHPELLSLAASHLQNKYLFKAAQVSHRWRKTLLSFSSLWSDIHISWGRGHFTFLERSKSAPVNVFMGIPHYTSHAAATEFLNRHATKIETLTVVVHEDDIPRLLPPMPSLKKLDLSWDRTLSLRHRADEFTFPTVTTLTVRRGYAFPFNVPWLTRLQVHSEPALSITKLLDFLNACPFLEELEVDYNEETERDHDTIDLPRLRLYSHSTSTDAHLCLFDKLSFPSSCSVVFNYWNGPSDLDRFYYEVLPFYNPSPLADIKRINLKTDDDDATVELIDAKNNRAYLVVYVGMSWQYPNVDRDITESYVSYLESIDIHTVEVLCVRGPTIWDPDHAEDVLSCLGKIRTLVLSDPAAIPYIRALGLEFDNPDGNNTANGLLCPILGTLVVHAWEFRNSRNEHILERLPVVAQRRKDAGIPFESVSLFIGCSWYEPEPVPMELLPALEQLKECVEKFDMVVGDDALDWNLDDYFFDGLDVRRDRHPFRDQRIRLRAYRWE